MKRQDKPTGLHSPETGAEQKNDDLIWGLNPVAEELAANPRAISEIMLERGKAGPRRQNIIDLAREHNIRLRFLESDRFPVPSHARHQGVAARRTEAQLLQLDELLEGVEITPDTPFPRILAIDCIQDPHNLGAILRSALASGFDSVILTRERSAPLSGTVAKTSAGAVSRLRICQVANLAEALKTLQRHRFWIFGAVADRTAPSIYDIDYSLPLCLVVGGEGKGIRPLVRKQCDQLVTIPMQSGFNSLNASVAAAIAMFEINRPRPKSSDLPS